MSAKVPAAAEGGAGASTSVPARPPFLALLEDFPDLFQKEVLERLDRVDRALLGRAGSAVRTAVKRSGLPRVGGSAEGPRVGIAAFCQSLSSFVWAVANGCAWQRVVTEKMAEYGHVDTCATLAKGGHLEVLQWAREHGCLWNEGTCEFAAEGGHLEVLQWAREHGCRWDAVTCRLAAKGGHQEMLQWAREHGCPWDSSTCHSAAADGQLETLKWAREHDCPWSWATCANAASSGHVEVLQWAREHGCQWNKETCARAAVGGHLDVLRWAWEHGCPSELDTCSGAARGGHLEAGRDGRFFWIVRNSYSEFPKFLPVISHVPKYMPNNVEKCRYKLLRRKTTRQHFQKVPKFPRKCLKFREYSVPPYLEVLQWAWERDFSWNADTCSEAAAHGHLEVRQCRLTLSNPS